MICLPATTAIPSEGPGAIPQHMTSQTLASIPADLRTPFLWLDLDQAAANLRKMRGALPGVDLFYAVKCNPDPRLLHTLHGLGAGFEIASPAEAKLLLEAGVAPS